MTNICLKLDTNKVCDWLLCFYSSFFTFFSLAISTLTINLEKLLKNLSLEFPTAWILFMAFSIISIFYKRLGKSKDMVINIMTKLLLRFGSLLPGFFYWCLLFLLNMVSHGPPFHLLLINAAWNLWSILSRT